MLSEEVLSLWVVLFHDHVKEEVDKDRKENFLQVIFILVQTLVNVLLEDVIGLSVMQRRVSIENALQTIQLVQAAC